MASRHLDGASERAGALVGLMDAQEIVNVQISGAIFDLLEPLSSEDRVKVLGAAVLLCGVEKGILELFKSWQGSV